MILIISKFIPKEDKETDFIRIASDLVDTSRAEEKNLEFEFVSSLEENEFLFIEKWEDMDGFNQHIASSHFMVFNQLVHLFIDDSETTFYNSEEFDLME